MDMRGGSRKRTRFQRTWTVRPTHGHMSYNAPADSEPAFTFWFLGSATFPTEIWLLSSARRKAGWVEGRACGRSRNPQC